MIVMLTLLLLGQQSTGPKWLDRACYDTHSFERNKTLCLREFALANITALELLSIYEPQSAREIAKSLLLKRDFEDKVLAAAVLARLGDFSIWPDVREEFLSRLASKPDSETFRAIAAFWKMTTDEDPKPGAVLRELEKMALELHPALRDWVLRELAAFDPGGWFRP